MMIHYSLLSYQQQEPCYGVKGWNESSEAVSGLA